MAAKKRGLGRGLDALLGGAGVSDLSTRVLADAPVVPQPGIPVDDGELRRVPVEFIHRSPFQPRREFEPEALEDLASSIRTQGVMQPLVVRPLAGQPGSFELIAGERRWRASQMAGLDHVPCVVREVPDQTALALAIIENIQREDLNPVEEAVALQRLQQEFGLTHEEVADIVGKSRATITNLLRLLKLEPSVRRLLEQGALEMGHARALLALEGEQQLITARQVEQKRLSVRETESLVQRLRDGKKKAGGGKPKRDPDIVRLEERLAENIGSPVSIENSPQGKGRLVIRYSSLNELDGIIGRLVPADQQ